MAYGVHLQQVPFPYLYTAKLPAPQSQPQNFPPLRSRTTDMAASHILNDTHRNNKPEEPNEGVDLHTEEQQHVKHLIQKSGTNDTSNLRDYSENSDFGDEENVEID